MKTAVIKRSIFINGRKTSVSLENEFWAGLHEIAKSRKTTAAKLVGDRPSTYYGQSVLGHSHLRLQLFSVEGRWTRRGQPGSAPFGRP
ncbi:MAG: ribbon-helix-helix domain-containing protein [Pseudolabrys sp.]